jgi:hypothetical protein
MPAVTNAMPLLLRAAGADELAALADVYDDPAAIRGTVMTCDPAVVAELTQRQVGVCGKGGRVGGCEWGGWVGGWVWV